MTQREMTRRDTDCRSCGYAYAPHNRSGLCFVCRGGPYRQKWLDEARAHQQQLAKADWSLSRGPLLSADSVRDGIKRVAKTPAARFPSVRGVSAVESRSLEPPLAALSDFPPQDADG
jgi:hypothetical protein